MNYAPQDGQQVAEAGPTMYASLAETGGVLDLWWLWFYVGQKSSFRVQFGTKKKTGSTYSLTGVQTRVFRGVSRDGGSLVVRSAIFDYR